MPAKQRQEPAAADARALDAGSISIPLAWVGDPAHPLAFVPGVPCRDLSAEEWAACPEWLQASIRVSGLWTVAADAAPDAAPAAEDHANEQ